MRSDRSQPGWAIGYALKYFGLPEQAALDIAGERGNQKLVALWESLGEGLYHQPEYALRQEWFHAFRLPVRRFPAFYESIPAGGVLVDWGCGTAEASRRDWIDQGKPTVLMDVEGPNFDYTRYKYEGFPVLFESAKTYPYGEFDALVLLDVLEHLPNPMEVFTELWKRLTPGGTALIWFDHSYPHPGHLKEAIDQIPRYEAFIHSKTQILHRGWVDWVAKPRKRWWNVSRYFGG